MKTLLKLAVAAALLTSASAALACGEEKVKAAEAQPQAAKPTVATKAEKKAAKPAKADAAKTAAPAVASRT